MVCGAPALCNQKSARAYRRPHPGLIADLEGDPFVRHALSNATCELYYRYGMFLAPLTAALTTLKHCPFGHCCPVRVHDGGGDVAKVKDPKKVAAGRAGAAARKAKQEERLLEQLRVAKESFRHPAGDGTSTNIPPKEAAAVSADKRPERREGLTNWTPWVVRACLAGGALVFLRKAQRRSPASVAPAPLTPRPSSLPPVLSN